MSTEVELQQYEVGPYKRAIESGYLALRDLEASMNGAPALPADAAEVAVSAAIRRLVADGQLPALGTRLNPARVYAPGSRAHKHAPPVAPQLDRPAIIHTTTSQANDLDAVKRVDLAQRQREAAAVWASEHAPRFSDDG